MPVTGEGADHGLSDLERIVRGLIEVTPIDEMDGCLYCGAEYEFDLRGHNHTADCPFRQAVEWCEKHEEKK